MVAPIRDIALRDREEPNELLPITENEEPRREKLRIARELPRFANSSTESENREPTRAKPRTDTEDPSRE
jgi:hypothetical protein